MQRIRVLFCAVGAAARSSGVTSRRRRRQDWRLHVLNIRHQQPPAYQASLSRYLRGESPHWKLYDPPLVSIYSSPNSLHGVFFSFFEEWGHNFLIAVSTPSVTPFFSCFFQALRHWLAVFLTSHSTQEVCRLKTGPCHCFHSPRTTELNLTPITRSQVPKILTSTHRGLILLLRAIYT